MLIRVVLRIIPWLIFAAAIVSVAVSYSSLDSEIIIARGFFGGPDIVGPKTIFTAFRVVIIDLLCAFAIAVMIRRQVSPEIQREYQTFWRIFLFAVAFKCLFQTLELISTPNGSFIYFCATLGVVILGIALAAIKGRKLISAFDRDDWKIFGRDRLMLMGLLLGYLAVAVGPVIYFR